MSCMKCEKKAVGDLGLCKIHLVERRKYQMRMRKNRIKNKVCTGCNKPATIGKVRCEQCRLEDRRRYKTRYDAKKAAGLCVYEGCQLPSKGKAQCDKHMELQRKYIAKKRKQAKKEK